jgi:hypothetical protein
MDRAIEPMTTTILLLGILCLQAPGPTGSSVTSSQVAASGADPLPFVELPARASISPKRGIGMIATGAFLTVAGSALTVAAVLGGVSTTKCKREQQGECWGGIAVAAEAPFAVVTLAVGVPLLTVGVQRNQSWRAWQREHGLTLRPQFDRGRGGWTLGVALRF